MGKKTIDILDVQIHDCTAKEAMKYAMDYIRTEPTNIIELVTVDVLVQVTEDPELKERMDMLDLVIAGDKAILEAAGVEDRRQLQEAETGTFLKMFLRYLHRRHTRFYLIADSEEALDRFTDFLEFHYKGIQIADAAIVGEDESNDDMIVNQINGAEADCVLSILSTPKLESFVVRNKHSMNLPLWIGIGRGMKTIPTGIVGKKNWFSDFMKSFIFKKEIEREKKRKESVIV